MRISDWSSDVCSSDLKGAREHAGCRVGGSRKDRVRRIERPETVKIAVGRRALLVRVAQAAGQFQIVGDVEGHLAEDGNGVAHEVGDLLIGGVKPVYGQAVTDVGGDEREIGRTPCRERGWRYR